MLRLIPFEERWADGRARRVADMRINRGADRPKRFDVPVAESCWWHKKLGFSELVAARGGAQIEIKFTQPIGDRETYWRLPPVSVVNGLQAHPCAPVPEEVELQHPQGLVPRIPLSFGLFIPDTATGARVEPDTNRVAAQPQASLGVRPVDSPYSAPGRLPPERDLAPLPRGRRRRTRGRCGAPRAQARQTPRSENRDPGPTAPGE